jgi:L-ascorbate metabolism protein UlaG (beta-lactamase superfamily)
LTIHFIGHASLVFEYNGKTVYTDPWSNLADYSSFPKADIILLTHQHFDHMDPKAIDLLAKDGTQYIETKEVFDALAKGVVMKNGEKKTVEGIEIEAVPAYNTTKGRDIYHPKGRDNGYIITFGKKRVYVAGDTEDIPEMGTFKNIDIAFLPMNQPYTMTPEQVAHAAKMINPKILYPYHYGETDVSKIKPLLAGDKNIEVRIRKLK